MKHINKLMMMLLVTVAGIQWSSPASAQLESNFVPITPCRLGDTREVGGPFGGQTVRDYSAYGNLNAQGGLDTCGIPDTAVAIHINFTAVNPSGFGYLRAWPYGEDEPGATLLNFTAGVNISNATALAICNDCDFDFNVKIYLASTELVIDAVGYYEPTTPLFEIGDTGPGGGIVFHVTDGGLHGLEAAPVDQGKVAWGCRGTDLPGANGLTIGTGSQNTANILAGCMEAGIAARIADAYRLGGFDDWYLPSRDELLLLGVQQVVVGGFGSSYYWTSSQHPTSMASGAELVIMAGGSGSAWDYKDLLHYVRAVRAF
jgi:hypothetical protein